MFVLCDSARLRAARAGSGETAVASACSNAGGTRRSRCRPRWSNTMTASNSTFSAGCRALRPRWPVRSAPAVPPCPACGVVRTGGGLVTLSRRLGVTRPGWPMAKLWGRRAWTMADTKRIRAGGAPGGTSEATRPGPTNPTRPIKRATGGNRQNLPPAWPICSRSSQTSLMGRHRGWTLDEAGVSPGSPSPWADRCASSVEAMNARLGCTERGYWTGGRISTAIDGNAGSRGPV